jgi:hypothetical protein
MALTFTTSGYTEVFKDGYFLSRHRSEIEAIESIVNDVSGVNYEIRRPVTKVAKKATTVAQVATLTVTGELSGHA